MRAGHSIEYGTLAGASGALKQAYYYHGYRHDEDLPELPVLEPDDEIQDPEEQYCKKELGEKLRELLDTLTPRESKILKMRFGIDCLFDHTLEEVAVRFDVTRERIRQIESKALRKMKHPDRRDELMQCLEPLTKKERDERLVSKMYAAKSLSKSLVQVRREQAKTNREAQVFVTKYPNWVEHLKQTKPDLFYRIKAHAHLVNKNFFEQYEVQMPPK